MQILSQLFLNFKVKDENLYYGQVDIFKSKTGLFIPI